jgi:hypothetical protein
VSRRRPPKARSSRDGRTPPKAGAPSLDEQRVAPLARVRPDRHEGDRLTAADDAKAFALVQGEAGRVLGKDAGLHGPASRPLGRVEQGQQQRAADALAVGRRGDIDRVLDDAAIDGAVSTVAKRSLYAHHTRGLPPFEG